MSTKTITVNYGSTTVTLNYVLATGAYADLTKNFTEHVLENNSRVRDDSGTAKRRWQFSHEVPISLVDRQTLDMLYAINDTLTLTENFTESGTQYTVHFEYFKKYNTSQASDAHYDFVFQEV